MLSWVTTKYQVGFVLYAGSLIVLLKNASKPRGTWVGDEGGLWRRSIASLRSATPSGR